MTIGSWVMGLAIALASVLWVELVRDLYHTLSHLWQPLYRLHVWHHKGFSSRSIGGQRHDLSPGSLVQRCTRIFSNADLKYFALAAYP